MTTLAELMGVQDESEEELATDSAESDEDYVPEKKAGWKQMNASVIKKLKKKKRKKKVAAPDLTELSLPKPATRLSADLDLTSSAVMSAVQREHTISKLGTIKLRKDAPTDAHAESVRGRKACTRGLPDDARVAQYRIF